MRIPFRLRQIYSEFMVYFFRRPFFGDNFISSKHMQFRKVEINFHDKNFIMNSDDRLLQNNITLCLCFKHAIELEFCCANVILA